MADTAQQTTTSDRGARAARLAGSLLVVLGIANVALAGIAAFTGSIRLADATAAVLGLLGLVTVVLGVLVARGRQWALVTSLVVFGGLFIVQAFAATGSGSAAPAVITLGVVVLPLVLALRASRSRD